MELRPTLVLIDFSNVVQTCWHPAIAAHEAGEKAWAEHWPTCQQCHDYYREGLGTPCPDAPKRYDLHTVYRENLRLKVGTLSESLQVPVASWVMVKDSRPVKRYAAFPAYKGNRERKDDYGDPRPAGEAFFRDLGCCFKWAPDYEADDAIAALTVGCRETANIVIVSSDKDLWQLLDPPRVRIFSPTLKVFIGPDRVTASFPKRNKTSPVPGIEDVKHIRLCKALWGDDSDNLPNAAPRMQAKLVPVIKASDGTLDDFLKRVGGAGLNAKERATLHAGIDQVATNYYVAGLMPECQVENAPRS